MRARCAVAAINGSLMMTAREHDLATRAGADCRVKVLSAEQRQVLIEYPAQRGVHRMRGCEVAAEPAVHYDYRALMQFGGVDLAKAVKESMRDQASFGSLDTTLRDSRYALRGLCRNPGFTVTTLLSLTLGLGASLAVFTVADNLLVRPLPYRNASRLAMIWEAERRSDNNRNVVSPANYLDWKAQSKSFSGMAAYSDGRFTLTGVDEPERIAGEWVSAGYFELLGVQPIAGRTLRPDEDRPGAIAASTDTHAVSCSIQLTSSPAPAIRLSRNTSNSASSS